MSNGSQVRPTMPEVEEPDPRKDLCRTDGINVFFKYLSIDN